MQSGVLLGRQRSFFFNYNSMILRIATGEGYVSIVKFFLENYIKTHDCRESFYLGALVTAAKNTKHEVGEARENA